MSAVMTALEVEDLMSDLAVSALDGTITSDADHDEEVDFRLPGKNGIVAGTGSAGGTGGCLTNTLSFGS